MNKESAVIDYPGCPPPIAIDRNHKEMARFSDANAHALEIAMDFLAQYARDAILDQDRRQLSPVLQHPSLLSKFGEEDKFSNLANYDAVFLVDDSPSMGGTRWELVKTILQYAAQKATIYDTDGIDIHFMNNTTASEDHIRDPVRAANVHRNIVLKGNTPIHQQLSKHLKSYLKKYRNRDDDDINFKGYNLIVLTDGEPNEAHENLSDISDVEDARVTKSAFRRLRKMLVNIANNLRELDAEEDQVGIQFCNVGSDPEAHEFFCFLDDRLKGKRKLDRDVSLPCSVVYRCHY